MMFIKIAIVISVLTVVINADCLVVQDPQVVFDCLGYITRGFYGAAINDLGILCSVARDIANCTSQQLGDCIAAEVGRSALIEITNMAKNCCPNRNSLNCSIRNEVIDVQQCFAADSFVTLADGKQKRISDVHSGDRVLAFNDQTKEIIATDVITMLDNQPNQFAMFKQLTTVSGRQLSLTSSHLLPTHAHGFVMAKNIRVGMTVYIVNDNDQLIPETISHIIDVVKQGYIAPLTEEGTLIVNHIAASCYATIDNHHLAHLVLTPMRWWYNFFGRSNDVIGVHWFPKMVYEITTFFLPSIIQK